MSIIDWIVLIGTLVFIVAYGIWKTRHINTTEGFLKGDYNMPWWLIGLSIMATQASAITFLSTPGQGYEDGMGFVQFYFGLPLAMVILSVFVLPLYYRLRVYTAYEFLENRFDLKTRSLTAVLFLVQRGLAAGITIYAPSIILSSILGWNLNLTNVIIGTLVIIYTVAGGTQAVSQTQKQQMIIIMTGMVLAFCSIFYLLPEDVSMVDSVWAAGQMDHMKVVDLEFDLSNRYSLWTGLLGGTFLFLSYFGTDQSQVQRYLSGRSLTQSRLGLMFNGLFKIPMQFFILFVGVSVFIFFQYQQSPLHFNPSNVQLVMESEYSDEYQQLQNNYSQVFESKKDALQDLMALKGQDDEIIEASRSNLNQLHEEELEIRNQADLLILSANPDLDVEDSDYVFITYILNYLPIGLIGLLLAVIFSAAMSSTASELNALATTTVIDIYKRSWMPGRDDFHYLRASKMFTIFWGLVALLFATFASLFDNLIEAVNIIGSVFYGTILGIFLVAFFIKRIKGYAVFTAAIIAEAIVLFVYFSDIDLAYLWLNAVGCFLVVIFSGLIQIIRGD